MSSYPKLKIFLVILSIPILIWVVALVWCEVQTLIFYDDFQYAYTGNSMLGDVESFKVLQCSEKYAKVYYISEGKTCANILTFEQTAEGWVETGWETVWSDSGTASDVVFPYWWHFIYGGL